MVFDPWSGLRVIQEARFRSFVEMVAGFEGKLRVNSFYNFDIARNHTHGMTNYLLSSGTGKL